MNIPDQLKNNTIVRWLLFFPLALISAYLAFVAIRILNLFHGTDFSEGFSLMRIGAEIMSNFAMGWVFIFVGNAVAPSHGKIVSLSMAIIALLLAGLGLFFSIAAKNWWGVLAWIATVIGISLALYQFLTKQEEHSTH